jgi:hypothetical protein
VALRRPLPRLAWVALGAVGLWACSSVDGPVDAATSGEAGAGGVAGAGGAAVQPPSACTKFMTMDECCLHQFPDELRCEYLRPNPMDGFNGACISVLTDDCADSENPCPPGKHCYLADPLSGHCGLSEGGERGVCVDD